MRKVGLVTSARSDWGIQRPIAAAIRERDDLELHIIATGMHLREEFGNTVDEIRNDCFGVAHCVDTGATGDSPADIAQAMGTGVTAFADLFAKWRPDVLTVLGDRFDMFPAAVAATPMLIPIAHIHGGEATLASFDDQLRHAMTKLAHVHFVATEEYARRVRQMGETEDRVHVVGAPGLDDVLKLQPLTDEELHRDFGFALGATNLLVVWHSETLAPDKSAEQAQAVFDAVARFDANVVIVRPNADTAHRAIHTAIDAYCEKHKRAKAPVSLPRRAFLSLMRAASAMIGNSSAGIIEAASFATPVVNIGDRQTGRTRAANVLDAKTETREIAAAIEKAIAPAFKATLRNLKNPYGDGQSAPRIAEVLARIDLSPNILRKPFVHL